VLLSSDSAFDIENSDRNCVEIDNCDIRQCARTAQYAAADNNAKAQEEARIGAFHFAKIHETASISYADDAKAMTGNNKPIHHTLHHYFEMAKAYRHLDRTRRFVKR